MMENSLCYLYLDNHAASCYEYKCSALPRWDGRLVDGDYASFVR
jgi:hypothetical protein